MKSLKEKLVETLRSGKVELFNRYRSIYRIEDIDLSRTNLSRINLSGADLHRVNLSETNLYRSDLSGSDFSGADLSDAILYRTNLSETNLYGANLFNIENYYSFIAYDTSKRVVHCFKRKNTWMIQAGCFWGTLEELEKKVKETHNSKFYLANIKLLKMIHKK